MKDGGMYLPYLLVTITQYSGIGYLWPRGDKIEIY
jgi:hypothetical protein